MSWLCWFLQCVWLHQFNVESAHSAGRMGIYQCHRCKSLSKGAPR